MFWVFLLGAGLFAALGLVFASGRGAGLISGYNTASAEEKARYDEKKLCAAMAKLMFALALCWLLAAFGALFHATILIWIGQALFLVAVIVGVVLLNTGNRTKK